jgi:hypothetical protein
MLAMVAHHHGSAEIEVPSIGLLSKSNGQGERTAMQALPTRPIPTMVLALGFIHAFSSFAASAHDARSIIDEIKGDDRRWDWFSSLKQPGTTFSCCSFLDCHQTEARQLVDKTWTAVIRDYKGTRWVEIPPNKIVKRPLSIDGDAYICYGEGSATHRENDDEPAYDSTIYCFVPPIPGY